MMPNSPPSSSSFSGHSAPPAGEFTFSRTMWQAPQQHAKPRQTVSAFNGNQRAPMNQGNSVDMADMNGSQISVSQLSIHPSINHVLSSGSTAESSLKERLNQQQERINQQDTKINLLDQRIIQQETRIFQLETSANETAKALDTIRAYLSSPDNNSHDPPYYMDNA